MKLNHVLSSLNQIEKTKFINCLDKLCSSSESCQKALTKDQMKDAPGHEITDLFLTVRKEYEDYVREELTLAGPAASLLVNILTRDGNSIARQEWLKTLYLIEWKNLNQIAEEVKRITDTEPSSEFDHTYRLKAFRKCLEVAYFNDQKTNREAKINDDERSILVELMRWLKVSPEEATAIEHLSNPINNTNTTVEEELQSLREKGIIFINRKSLEVIVADEVLEILHRIQGKVLADKHVRRILRCLSDAELSTILKNYGKRIRGVSRSEKIYTILHAGINIHSILSEDLYETDTSQNARKDRLKQLIEELDIQVDKLGVTLEDRIQIIVNSLKSSTDYEFNSLSAAGYKELVDCLNENFSGTDEHGKKERFSKRIQRVFELEPTEEFSTETLRALSITPHDLLFTLSNEEIKAIRDQLGLSKRGNPRSLILELFANADDKLIDNYVALAQRDLATLKANNIDISEAEIGSKFEETTRTIFEELGLNVNEDLRRSVNTAKDKADIIISLPSDGVIIGEAKTCKNGDFSSYSSVSRQVKAYANRCESLGKVVQRVLIVAPSFSTKFITAAEEEQDINVSLLTAEGLKCIYDAYQSKKRPNFSEREFMKSVFLDGQRIAQRI